METRPLISVLMGVYNCADTLEEAVDISKKVTGKNMSCLLSPAAASYGFFKNFEEKGDLFQKLVKQ